MPKGKRDPSRRSDHRLFVRVTNDERAALEAVAAELGISMSEVVRRAAVALMGAGPTLDGDERDEVAHLTGELNAVGRNLNQVARALNSGRFRDDVDMPALRDGLSQVGELLVQLAGLYHGLCADRRARLRRGVETTGRAA